MQPEKLTKAQLIDTLKKMQRRIKQQEICQKSKGIGRMQEKSKIEGNRQLFARCPNEEYS